MTEAVTWFGLIVGVIFTCGGTLFIVASVVVYFYDRLTDSRLERHKDFCLSELHLMKRWLAEFEIVDDILNRIETAINGMRPDNLEQFRAELRAKYRVERLE